MLNILSIDKKSFFYIWTGPQPDWDPDIVAALDDDLDLNDPNNLLDDDFIMKANVCQDIEKNQR